MDELKSQQTKIRWGLVSYFYLSYLAFNQFRDQIHAKGPIKPYTKFWIIENIGFVALGLLFLIVVYAWLWRGSRLLTALKAGLSKLTNRPKTQLAFLVGLFLVYPVTVAIAGKYLANFYPRIWLYLTISLVGYAVFRARHPQKHWQESVLFSLLLFAVSFFLASFVPLVSTYPLTLDWSEASRYYLASLYFDQSVYGLDLPMPHRDFSRYLLQSLPYILPNSSLWVHRFWQALLRFSFPLLTGMALASRFWHKDNFRKWIFIFWAMFFLIQGPVFYPMLSIIAVMFWGFDSKKLPRSTILILLLSVWAGLTRINWIPMPALIGITIYFIEQKLENKDFKSLARYLALPVFWAVAGSLIGLVVQRVYEANSGLPANFFSTSFSSDLLWYRLWPNASWRFGILLNLLFVCAPLLVVLRGFWQSYGREWHWVRYLGIASILFVLLLGGVVVSVKIGGGTNLHNLDAFMVMLLLMGSYAYFYPVSGKQTKPFHNVTPLLLTTILLPVFYLLYSQTSLAMPEFEGVDESLEKITTHAERAAFNGDEVLFLTERQLVTFDLLAEPIPLVQEYEKLILMEMVTGGNDEYLTNFEDDLRNHRFGLIFTDKLAKEYKIPKVDSLAEENNIFIDHVTNPLRCYYESIQWVRKGSIEFWLPRQLPRPGCE